MAHQKGGLIVYVIPILLLILFTSEVAFAGPTKIPITKKWNEQQMGVHIHEDKKIEPKGSRSRPVGPSGLPALTASNVGSIKDMFEEFDRNKWSHGAMKTAI
ncbi:hypothetical protein GH714_024838 [Hevea brasiliensis]|uniref:Transmembrane protein n=1 Tax=Hevea brasiliensis TaxID=3981 RepID=A0A6A6LN17_HEVBR|nr:hypothetical protein GH714_024838 [Hevea brasiliensis]